MCTPHWRLILPTVAPSLVAFLSSSLGKCIVHHVLDGNTEIAFKTQTRHQKSWKRTFLTSQKIYRFSEFISLFYVYIVEMKYHFRQYFSCRMVILNFFSFDIKCHKLLILFYSLFVDVQPSKNHTFDSLCLCTPVKVSCQIWTKVFSS